MSETLVTCPVCQIPNFTEQGLRAHRCKGPLAAAVAQAGAVEGHAHIVPDHDLAALRSSLEAERNHLIDHENRFKETTLPHYLAMGLVCLKAHAVFAVPDAADRGSRGGRGKSSSTVEELSGPTSFDAWLKAEVPWLPTATAYRYKRAAQGLGLTHESSPEDLATLLAAAREASGELPSLTRLANLIPPPVPDPEKTEDPNDDEDKAGEARVQITTWIDHWDRFERSGGLEEADIPTLKNLEEFHRNTLDRITRRLKSAR